MCVYLHSANLTLSMRAIRFVKKEIQAASQALCYTDYKDTQFVCVCVCVRAFVWDNPMLICACLCVICVYMCTAQSGVQFYYLWKVSGPAFNSRFSSIQCEQPNTHMHRVRHKLTETYTHTHTHFLHLTEHSKLFLKCSWQSLSELKFPPVKVESHYFSNCNSGSFPNTLLYLVRFCFAQW